jgi:hypothetical protein
MKFLASYVMKGPIHALSVSVLFGLLSIQILPAAVLCASIVALFTLRKGHKNSFILFFATVVLSYLASLFIPSRPGLDFPIVILLLVPVWISALILRATESQGLAISAAIFCAALFAIFIELYSGNAIQWWGKWLETAVTGVKNASYQQFADSGSLTIMNGLIASVLGIGIVISLLLARWLQANLFNPGGFAAEFNNLIIPKKLLYFISLILLICFLINRDLFNDLLIVFSILYFFQGLAILHFYVEKNKFNKSMLLPVYLLIFFLPQYAIIGLAGAGVMDTFLNFRKQLK